MITSFASQPLRVLLPFQIIYLLTNGEYNANITKMNYFQSSKNKL